MKHLNIETAMNLKDVFGDKMAEAIEAFQLEITQRLESLYSDPSIANAIIQFHSIRGTSAAYAARTLSEKAADCETQCRENLPDTNDIQQMTREIVDIWNATQAELAAL